MNQSHSVNLLQPTTRSSSIGRILNLIVLAVLFVTSSLLILAILQPNSLRLMTVQTGSMQPIMPIGSLVVSQPVAEYHVNDIITFRPAGQHELVTHRIIAIQAGPAGQQMTTKGDANELPDATAIPAKQILGRVRFVVPYIGRLFSFAQTQVGLILLVIIPATILFVSEAQALVREWQIRRFRSDRA